MIPTTIVELTGGCTGGREADSVETGGEDSGDIGRGGLGEVGDSGNTGVGDTETGSSDEEVSGNRKERGTEGAGDTVEDGEA